jgi:hypothetical protein
MSTPTSKWDCETKPLKSPGCCPVTTLVTQFSGWCSPVARMVRTGVVRGHWSVVGGRVAEEGPVKVPDGRLWQQQQPRRC